ncbi:MAG: metalloregulator ArsR/SmtB family transcription factor [Candidatus Pacearchaeota archaeon]
MIDKHTHNLKEREIYGAYKIFFGTLVSESRLKIINLLRKGRKNVSEIIKELDMEQTGVSHDLSRLKKCGFVINEKSGRYIYYKLNKKTIKPLMNLIDKHMSQYCIHILKKKKRR